MESFTEWHWVITEAVYERYLSRLLAGNRTECKKIVEEFLAADFDIRDLYLNSLLSGYK